MKVKFSCNLFLLPYLRVKAQYRMTKDTLFDVNVPNSGGIFVMVCQYTQKEYN